MSIIRAASTNNILPLNVYERRYFAAYNEYYRNEIKRLENVRHLGLESKISKLVLHFIELIFDGLNSFRDSLELMEEVTKFCRCLDDEMSLMKHEARRIHFKDSLMLNELYRMHKAINDVNQEVRQLETEKNYWDVLFRVRNIRIFKVSQDEIPFFPGEGNYLKETPPKDLIQLFKVCENFIERSQLDLALSFAQGKLEEIFKETQKETLDIAIVYALIASIHNHKDEYKAALDNLGYCLEIREKLLAKDHKDIALVQFNIALMSLKNRKLKEALRKMEPLQPLFEKNFRGTETQVRALELNAKILEISGHLNPAIAYYGQTLALMEKLKLQDTDLYFYVTGILSKCYMRADRSKDSAVCLENYSKLVNKTTYDTDSSLSQSPAVSNFKMQSAQKESLFPFLKSHNNNDISAELIYAKCGSIDNYDVANFMESIRFYFKSSVTVITALDNWRYVSIQKK